MEERRMPEEKYCETCGRTKRSHCSFCGAELPQLDMKEWEAVLQQPRQSLILLEIAVIERVDIGWDMDELTACPNCTSRFLAREAVQEIDKKAFT